MRTIAEVQQAKELMTEAMTWSVTKWLREKKKVRKAADRANEKLDEAAAAVKKSWSDPLRNAYLSLNGSGTAKSIEKSQLFLARSVKAADEDALRSRLEAEATFDKAEKQLSTALAREGCRQAIRSWELYELAIGKAESAAQR